MSALRATKSPHSLRPRIRFDRNELAGAFGDIGTDLPLIVGMILAAGLDSASVLIMFGAMQVLTGLIYRFPMPVQPLKAMAAIVITGKQPLPSDARGGETSGSGKRLNAFHLKPQDLCRLGSSQEIVHNNLYIT